MCHCYYLFLDDCLFVPWLPGVEYWPNAGQWIFGRHRCISFLPAKTSVSPFIYVFLDFFGRPVWCIASYFETYEAWLDGVMCGSRDTDVVAGNISYFYLIRILMYQLQIWLCYLFCIFCFFVFYLKYLIKLFSSFDSNFFFAFL